MNSYSTSLHRQQDVSDEYQAPNTSYGKKKKNSNKTIAACLVTALLAGFLITFIDIPNEDHSYEKIEIQTVTENTYFELSGDFLPEREIFAVSMTDDGRIAFALSDEISSGYDHYSWHFFDNDHVSSVNPITYTAYKGETLEKDEPVLYYLSQKVGEYNVTVKCTSGANGSNAASATYSGTVSYVGTITKEYTWRYHGVEYSSQITFCYDDYRTYRDLNPNSRHLINYNRIASFVTSEDPAITELAESLKESYCCDRDMPCSEFAAFVLAFVQICFEYPPSSNFMGADRYQYGQEEYFAYPMETIFYGMGDCEDTSILAAALFKALGYEAGVIIVPGHALAAVGLVGYSCGTYSSRLYEEMSFPAEGFTYYACETTVGTPQEIGLVSTSGYGGVPYSDYIGKQRYGLYTV